MDQKQPYQKDIETIRQLMERSSKFISLSGLSGIMAGVYALAGAAAAYAILPSEASTEVTSMRDILIRLTSIAAAVLIFSLATGFWLSNRKARRAGLSVWDPTGKRLVVNLVVPLLAGGLFILSMMYHGQYELIAPSFLIFYGLALINASPNLFEEVRYLGYSEILTGLICAMLPWYGLHFWAIGFGVFHIVYGAVMYRKYDQ